MSAQRYVVHTDFDGFCVAVERVCNPYLRDRPVALGDVSRARSIVAAVSPESRRAGVYVAMPIDLARKRCPDLVVVDANFTLYGRVSQTVQKHLARYSPRIEPASWDATYLDLTGMQALFGAAVDTAARLRRELRDSLRLDLAVGVATNKLVSHVASRITRPSGVSEVPPGEEAQFLAPLPVGHLPGIGAVMQKRLRDFNIQTIGELGETEPGFLLQAFGPSGRTLYEHARGIDDSPVGAITQTPRRETVSREVTLTHNSNNRNELAAALRGLVEGLGSQLRVSGRLVQRVRVNVVYADSGRSERTVRLPQATNLDCRLLVAAEELLRQALTRRVTVRQIGMEVTEISTPSAQLQLFAQDTKSRRQSALMGAVDAIRSRYGGGAIRAGACVAIPA